MTRGWGRRRQKPSQPLGGERGETPRPPWAVKRSAVERVRHVLSGFLSLCLCLCLSLSLSLSLSVSLSLSLSVLFNQPQQLALHAPDGGALCSRSVIRGCFSALSAPPAEPHTRRTGKPLPTRVGSSGSCRSTGGRVGRRMLPESFRFLSSEAAAASLRFRVSTECPARQA